jgi:hypothetical protein
MVTHLASTTSPLHKQAPRQSAAPCTDPASCLTHREGGATTVTVVAPWWDHISVEHRPKKKRCPRGPTMAYNGMPWSTPWSPSLPLAGGWGEHLHIQHFMISSYTFLYTTDMFLCGKRFCTRVQISHENFSTR